MWVPIFDAARWLARAGDPGRREPRIRIEANECIHIGDDELEDYWGGEKCGVGWGAVLLRRRKGEGEGEDGGWGQGGFEEWKRKRKQKGKKKRKNNQQFR